MAINIKDTSEVAKNAAQALTSVVLLVVVGLVITGSPLVRKVLDNFNVSKIVVGGVTIERGQAEKFLSESADQLPRTEAALSTAKNDLEKLRAAYATSEAALREAQKALADAQRRLSQTSSVAAAQQAAAASKAAGQALAQTAPAAKAATQAVNALAQAKQDTQAQVRAIPVGQAAQTGYLAVFGGDPRLDLAQAQAKRGEALGLGRGEVFLRQGYFRSVIRYPTLQDARAALPKVRTINRYAADGYVVNIATWCPAPEAKGGYHDCRQ